ncbi:MAG: ribonuclease HII [Candidatus Omnitrophota bacterium]
MMLYHENKARHRGFNLIAGVDEVGRGSLAGPIVACAVILKKTKFKNYIFDSKALSASQRMRAFDEIINNSFFGLGIVNEKIIDKLNIKEANRIAMEMALRDLKLRPDCALIDGNVSVKAPCSLKNIIKGDTKSLSIASASIVAKVIRDRIMCIYHKVYPRYKFNLHKGYATRSHLKAINKFGPAPIHRMSFSPFRE